VGYHKALGLATAFGRRIAAKAKGKSPLARRAFSKGYGSLAYRVARDTRDIGPRNAEVGKIAIGQALQFGDGAIVKLPALITARQEVEHGQSPMD